MAVIDKREAKADLILEKGIDILWAKGFNGTSVNDIVKAAGVPKGSFYFYFESKEDFVLKAIDRYFSKMFSPAVKILRNETISPKARLLEFYEFRINIMKDQLECQKGCMVSNLANEMSEHNELIRSRLEIINNKINKEIIDVAREAQESGEIRNDIDVSDMIEFIEDAGKGAMVSMKQLKSSYPIDNVLNMVKAIFFA